MIKLLIPLFIFLILLRNKKTNNNILKNINFEWFEIDGIYISDWIFIEKFINIKQEEINKKIYGIICKKIGDNYYCHLVINKNDEIMLKKKLKINKNIKLPDTFLDKDKINIVFLSNKTVYY